MIFSGPISTLAELISPMTQQEFFDYYTKQLPVFIHGGAPSRVAKLISVNDVSNIIQKETYPGGRIYLRREGTAIPPMLYTTRENKPRMSLALIRGILNAGASLILNSLQDTHPRIGDLAQALELEFSENVWANGYVTTKEGGAFAAHYDDHDVIILQISGSKRWHLSGRTEEFPVREYDSARDIPPKADEEIDILSAGEVLFVPRGVWHRAEVVGSPSFHITFGIMGETGISFVRQAVNNLMEEALFRKYLPRVGGEKFLLEHEKKIKSFLHDWVEQLSVETFLANRDAATATRSSDVHPWNSIPLNSEAKIWLALRRRSPIVDINGKEEIVVGGRAYHICLTDRLILQIVGKCSVLRFDELIGQVREQGDTIAEAELAAAVSYLSECGILNISMDDGTNEHDPKPEQDVPHGSIGPSTVRSRQGIA